MISSLHQYKLACDVITTSCNPGGHTCFKCMGNCWKCGMEAILAQYCEKSFSLVLNLSRADRPKRYILVVGGFLRDSST